MTEETQSLPSSGPKSASAESADDNQLLTFLGHMQFRLNILDDARKALNVYLAQDFNVFNYIKPDENRISEIIANLLDPQGNHGQGGIFLEEFFRTVGRLEDLDDKDIWSRGKVSVIREHVTDTIPNSQRRVDILVKFQSSPFLLAIENKPFAGDQPNQLKDYSDHLQEKSGGEYLLIYLSGDGSEPDSLPPERRAELKSGNRFLTLSYRDQLKNWLRSCKQRCEADKIRLFIQDFVEYIETDSNFSTYDETGEE